MKKSLTLHLAWAVVAIVAFVVGSQAFPSSKERAGEASSTAQRGRGTHRSGGEPNAPSVRSSRGNIAKGKTSGKTAAKRGTPLSEGEIVSLGKQFQTESNPIERRLIFAKLISGLTAENAETMRQQIVHLSQDSSEFREFHYAWGALAGETAVQHGADTPKRDMAAALSGWASADPDAALAWYSALPENEQMHRGDFKWGTVYGLSNADPSTATEFVLSRQAAGDKHAEKMINVVADAMLRTGDSETAAQWSQSLPEGDIREEAINKVARTYAERDPSQATAWLQTLDDGKGKLRGFNAAYSSWASKDPEAAAQSLNKMPESSSRDYAVNGYARRVSRKDPAAGVEWASSISNEKMRNKTLIDTGRTYMRRDPAAAKQWITTNNIPSSISRHILPKSKK